MEQELLIGTRGWDVDAWQGSFYPDELPPEWRFSYYSNLYRSVLVPGDAWERTPPAQVQEWLEDSDPEFRFVCELPPALSRPHMDPGALDRFLKASAPLATRVAAWLLRVGDAGEPEPTWLAGRLTELGAAFPLCVDLAPEYRRQASARAVVRDAGASLCWHPDADERPDAYGEFLVALTGHTQLKALRALVETLGGWMGGTRGAGCFFETPDAAPKLAQEARILAELLQI